MKKIIFVVCMLCTSAAFAANEESVTSREYVDAGLAATQSTLTTTGTGAMTFDSSETDGIGQKPIYNPNGDYAAQQDALVSASTANAAVQNAIAAEFVCIAWKNDDPNDECLLVQIKNTTPRPSGKNLLDPSFMDNSTYDSLNIYGASFNAGRILPTVGGKTYTLSATAVYTGTYYYYIKGLHPDGTSFIPQGGQYMWACSVSECNNGGEREKTFTFTAESDAVYVVYFANTPSKRNLTLTEYQMEEGTTATAYEPYQNLYLPAGQ
ncbi:MAG: hypothetical protein J6T57_02665 [Alphaproteobacteria bacterium]|nr:hypothetical protein [Alphaproteobacteria bacterium]